MFSDFHSRFLDLISCRVLMSNPIPYTDDDGVPLIALLIVGLLVLLAVFWDDFLDWMGWDQNSNHIPDGIEDLLPGS